MNHKKFKELIQLLLYDELSESEKHLIKNHLSECKDCRAEVEQFKNLHIALGEKKPFEPSEQMLREARQQFFAALRIEQSKQPFWERLKVGFSNFFPTSVSPQYKVAFGGIAALAFGVLIGYVAFSPAVSQRQTRSKVVAETDPFTLGNLQITNLRFLDPDASDGEIEISFDALRRVTMKGSIDEERIQKVLTHAVVNEQNPGVRLQSVRTIGTYQQKLPDMEVKAALLIVLKTDENPGVRKEALNALTKLPFDEVIKQALLYVLLHDNNSGLRIAAINSLETAMVEGHHVGQEALSVLKEKMETDDNNYIRIHAQNVLEEVKQQ